MMKRGGRRHRLRRTIVSIVLALVAGSSAVYLKIQEDLTQPIPAAKLQSEHNTNNLNASDALSELPTKGRAPKTDYRRDQFGAGWQKFNDGCDMRNQILRRDLTDVKLDENCKVLHGKLNDPYTGKVIDFVRGPSSSDKVQIDHVVALSNAWQTGAQQLSPERRAALANDPLNLLAVDGSANQQKGDADAATWLPPNKSFRCAYVARQIAVKRVYGLWVTEPEKIAMRRILATCPEQKLLI